VTIVNVEPLAARLRVALDYVRSFSALGLLDPGAAAYDSDSRQIRMPTHDSWGGLYAYADMHELLHAYDDMMGRLGQAEDTEARAYTLAALLRVLYHVRQAEDRIERREKCHLIQQAWRDAWDIAAKIVDWQRDRTNEPIEGWRSEYMIFWQEHGLIYEWVYGPQARHIESADVLSVGGEFGLQIKCPPLEAYFNRRMNALGILDTWRPGKCCEVKCPKDLPEVFR